MGNLSEHFSKEELDCPCCGKFIRNDKLIKLAEQIREILGVPMTPTSSTRCRKHNTEVGGEDTSNHLKGEAMDFWCSLGATVARDKILKAWNQGKLPLLGGLGYYRKKNFIHIDITKAADGHLRRWNG